MFIYILICGHLTIFSWHFWYFLYKMYEIGFLEVLETMKFRDPGSPVPVLVPGSTGKYRYDYRTEKV